MNTVCCTWLRRLGLLSVTPVIVGLAASELSAQSVAGSDPHPELHLFAAAEDAAPLLPKGTILHIIGFLDTSEANPNVADPRNWAGGGRRSVANMFIDLGQHARLTEEQFQAALAERRAKMKSRNEYDVGCFLCWAEIPTTGMKTEEQGGAG